MRRPNRIDGKPPKSITGKYVLEGRVIEMIYEKAEEIEKRGGYCSIERAIHCLLLELYSIKESHKPCHLSHI